LYSKTVPDIHYLWMRLEPSQEDFTDLIQKCYDEGLKSISVFKRWSKHPNLKIYANALEEWDYTFSDSTDELISEFLNI